MALIDISEVLRDPDFTSPVTLISTVEGEDEDGTPVHIDSDYIRLDAVVTQNARQFTRTHEYVQHDGSLTVRFVTQDAVAFLARGYDHLIWRGRLYLINSASDYAQFGQGCIRLDCSPEETLPNNDPLLARLLAESAGGAILVASDGTQISAEVKNG